MFATNLNALYFGHRNKFAALLTKNIWRTMTSSPQTNSNNLDNVEFIEQSNCFSYAANVTYIENLYKRWLVNPFSVHVSWHAYFRYSNDFALSPAEISHCTEQKQKGVESVDITEQVDASKVSQMEFKIDIPTVMHTSQVNTSENGQMPICDNTTAVFSKSNVPPINKALKANSNDSTDQQIFTEISTEKCIPTVGTIYDYYSSKAMKNLKLPSADDSALTKVENVGSKPHISGSKNRTKVRKSAQSTEENLTSGTIYNRYLMILNRNAKKTSKKLADVNDDDGANPIECSYFNYFAPNQGNFEMSKESISRLISTLAVGENSIPDNHSNKKAKTNNERQVHESKIPLNSIIKSDSLVNAMKSNTLRAVHDRSEMNIDATGIEFELPKASVAGPITTTQLDNSNDKASFVYDLRKISNSVINRNMPAEINNEEQSDSGASFNCTLYQVFSALVDVGVVPKAVLTHGHQYVSPTDINMVLMQSKTNEKCQQIVARKDTNTMKSHLDQQEKPQNIVEKSNNFIPNSSLKVNSYDGSTLNNSAINRNMPAEINIEKQSDSGALFNCTLYQVFSALVDVGVVPKAVLAHGHQNVSTTDINMVLMQSKTNEKCQQIVARKDTNTMKSHLDQQEKPQNIVEKSNNFIPNSSLKVNSYDGSTLNNSAINRNMPAEINIEKQSDSGALFNCTLYQVFSALVDVGVVPKAVLAHGHQNVSSTDINMVLMQSKTNEKCQQIVARKDTNTMKSHLDQQKKPQNVEKSNNFIPNPFLKVNSDDRSTLNVEAFTAMNKKPNN